MISAKYLSVFLKNIMPMTNKIAVAIKEINNKDQFIGAFPKIAA